MRKRYIAFHLDGDTSKKPLIEAIKKRDFDEIPWLIYFDGEYGILRCGHLEKEKAIDLLRSIKRVGDNKVKIETIATSGTIKKIKEKIGISDSRSRPRRWQRKPHI